MNEKYTSHAEWPQEAGVGDNVTIDSHPTRELAEGVCNMLRTNGFGGDRKIFPLRTWVEPVQECYDVLNDGKPLSIIWADSPEHAISIFKAAHKTTAKLHHNAVKLGEVTAVLRIQDEA